MFIVAMIQIYYELMILKFGFEARDSRMADAGEGLFAKQLLKKVFIQSFQFCISSKKAFYQTLSLFPSFFDMFLKLVTDSIKLFLRTPW